MAFFHESVTEEEVTLYLGALFHDIGKFFQRTGDKKAKEIIRQKFATVIGDENRTYVKHQEWSAYFADEFLKDYLTGTVVLRHHHPETHLQHLVAIGDKLSAAERENEETGQKSKAKTAPLVAILSQVSIDGNQCNIAYKKLRPVSTGTLEDLFPVSNPEEALREDDYLYLWEQFINELQSIAFKNSEHRLWALTGLLEKYCSNIPSAYYFSKPTISLWLHSKLSTAIAFALYRQGLELERASKIEKALKEKFFQGKDSLLLDEAEVCLLKADISGIQDFVYDTAMDGAVKALRGRSFYITYLMNTIAKFILRTERLPVTNILYSGGGHFYLLLPAKAMHRLEEYRAKCDWVMFNAHKGKLAVLLDAVELKFSDFGDEQFLKKWQEVGTKIQVEKGKKFWRLIQKQQDKFFGPFGEQAEVCPHCGREIHGSECAFCNDFIELGDRLLKSRYISEKNVELRDTSLQSLQDIFQAFGTEFELTTKATSGRCFALRESDYSWNNSYGLYRLPAYFSVRQDGSIKTFEEIAQNSQGIKTWGVLRGDVDNLGRVFAEGLGKDQSISRVAALSYDMSFYFAGMLPDLIAKSSYSDKVGVIYAGGDDFFIVGSWDALPPVAEMINQNFKKFASFNPSLTVSMAISLAPAYKYPLYRVALSAGEELEDKAKSYTRPVQGRQKDKDAIAFLNTAIGWEDYKDLRELQEIICSALHKDAPHALLQILCKAWLEKEFAEENHEIFQVWRVVYALSRLMQRVKASKAEIVKIQDRVLVKGNNLFKYTRQAARWAELLMRSTGGVQNAL